MASDATERHIFGKVVFGLFLLSVASLAVQQPPIFRYEGYPITATDVLFPVVGFLFFVSVLVRQSSFRWTPAYIFLAVYVAAFFFATAFAPNVSTSVTKSLATAYLVGLSVLAVNIVDREERMRLAIGAWLIGAVIPVAIGIFTLALFYLSPDNTLLPYLTYHYGAVPVGNYPRLSSTFVSASMFCNYLNVGILLLLIERIIGWLNDWVWWIFFVACCLCLVFTISSGIGAAVLGVAVWIWYRQRPSRSGNAVLAMGTAVFILFLLPSFFALSPHSTAPYSINIPVVNAVLYPSPRLLVWTEALNTFTTNILAGNGPGSPSASVLFENSEGGFSRLTDAHNTYLSIAAQTGIFGLLTIVGLCIYLLRVGFSDRSDHVRFGLATIFLTAFVLQGLNGSFEDVRHLWVLIGMLVASTLNKPNG